MGHTPSPFFDTVDACGVSFSAPLASLLFCRSLEKCNFSTTDKDFKGKLVLTVLGNLFLLLPKIAAFILPIYLTVRLTSHANSSEHFWTSSTSSPLRLCASRQNVITLAGHT